MASQEFSPALQEARDAFAQHVPACALPMLDFLLALSYFDGMLAAIRDASDKLKEDAK